MVLDGTVVSPRKALATSPGNRPEPKQTKMSAGSIEGQYLYRLPAHITTEFCKVMDSLDRSDWLRFASRVLHDQVDLRLAERSERPTDCVLHRWGVQNGTVGELLHVLNDLKLLRARDIILRWSPVPPSDRPAPTPWPQPPPKPSFSDQLFSPPLKDQHQKPQSNMETRPLTPPVPRPLPRPGPPPSALRTDGEKRLEDLDSPPRPPEWPTGVGGPPTSDPSCDTQLVHSALCWPLEEVLRGTENFSKRLCIGEGGFGHVFRATMRNTDYAVKKLKEDSEMDWSLVKQSFRTEVEKLTQYRHPNIVDFGGYCMERGVYCLVYVFMPNGSLEDWLQSKTGGALSWQQRVRVLLGSAKAIQFLHESTPALIHGDVKSSNILLAEGLEPKLGDFGLARLCRAPPVRGAATSSVVRTQKVRGTLAYLPEEYILTGELGVEIDTYSFGVVLLELLTGRRALETDGTSRTRYLKDLVRESEEEADEERGRGGAGKSARVSQEERISQAAAHIWKKHLDPQLRSQFSPGSQELCKLACRCLDRRKRRPRMKEVFRLLQEVQQRLDSSSPAPPASAPVDSLADRFSRLGPQEDTFHCPPNLHPPPGALTSQDGLRCASLSRVPCESDESQGFSQYLVSGPGEPDSSSSSLSSCGRNGLYGSSPQGSPGSRLGSPVGLGGAPALASCQAGASGPRQGIVMNPAKERFFHKLALYEEGRIPSAELLSSSADSGGELRRPEESDEFDC
ncbi:interleukin-1 receptor-associated kinase 1 isoform X2 [Lepisosteus oculatus]|uniref:interleukin-1 receptor-associated kinase 1 isoform X2 n=1 Tax=Lepisosteus oculatus TaxID=7918 RepID=UPI0035F52775